MRRKFIGTLLGLSCLSLSTTALADTASLATSTQKPPVQVAAFKIGNGQYSVNGYTFRDAAPYIKNDRTYLPLRFAAYAVGIGDNNIYWDGANQKVYLQKNNKIIVVTIGSNTMQVGDQTIQMDVPAEIMDGRTMLPIAYIAKAFDCDVHWDGDKKIVTIIAH
ncbi:hypothetical protein DNHGIG_32320 [Collibacillus ludicampi]|uniref:Copper amine oxidase-like N-terminal domain-containing protein n=1 Tax=Collibacillus ludicampi TaxID=2771369 RepID=A0AAV4LJ62_9BACL|nr:copper amine oxidase N-terminal domain-containing protein [Collibacillus ludicampi]GIM47683.1 hypothetical protein DNHGIG_32320 [Collibacillus ludicampi]